MIHYYRCLFVKMKVFNYSELHFFERTSFKIHIFNKQIQYIQICECKFGVFKFKNVLLIPLNTLQIFMAHTYLDPQNTQTPEHLDPQNTQTPGFTQTLITVRPQNTQTPRTLRPQNTQTPRTVRPQNTQTPRIQTPWDLVFLGFYNDDNAWWKWSNG